MSLYTEKLCIERVVVNRMRCGAPGCGYFSEIHNEALGKASGLLRQQGWRIKQGVAYCPYCVEKGLHK